MKLNNFRFKAHEEQNTEGSVNDDSDQQPDSKGNSDQEETKKEDPQKSTGESDNLEINENTDAVVKTQSDHKLKKFTDRSIALMHEVDTLLQKQGKEKKYFKDGESTDPETAAQTLDEAQKQKTKKAAEEKQKQKAEALKKIDEEVDTKPPLNQDGKPDCKGFCEKLKNASKQAKEKKASIQQNSDDSSENNDPQPSKINEFKIDEPLPQDLSEEDAKKYRIYYTDT